MAHQIDESKPKYLSQTRFMSGRRIIKTSVTEITDENVVDVLRKALAMGQRVGRDQYKIDGLEWAWLTAAQWERILSILSNFFVYVEFNDPVTNKRKTVRMYCGDRTGEPYWVTEDGTPTHYRNCKVNLIDTGE